MNRLTAAHPALRRWNTRRAMQLVGLSGMAATVWWSIDRGMQYREDPDVKVQAAPLIGEWDWRPSFGLLLPLIVGVLTIWKLPTIAKRLSFGYASFVTAVLAGSFAVTLAGADGWDRIMEPVVHPTEYWANLDTLPIPSQMLQDYATVEFMVNYSVHVKGHPPGFLLVLQAFEAVGLGHPWVNATLIWLAIGLVAAGVLRTLRTVGDEAAARAAAPFLVVAPLAIWMATSADAFFAALSVWGMAFIADSASAPTRIHRWTYGCAGGVLSAFSLYCSYGAALFAPIAVTAFVAAGVVAVRGNQPGPIPKAKVASRLMVSVLPILVGVSLIVGLFKAFGFWWFDGWSNTKDFYEWGTAQFRPWQYFVVANVAALLIAVGPAVVVGITQLGRRSAWVPVGASLAAVGIANASLMTKAEVERIWLPFMVLLLPATASLQRPRLWLVVQLGLALLLQAWLASKW
jgi:methylthioxylose transferase